MLRHGIALPCQPGGACAGSDTRPTYSGVVSVAQGPPQSGANPLPQHGQINRAAIGIGAYAGAFSVTFGAVAVSSGLNPAQTVLLSLAMFTGASQFAFVGVIAAGGSPFAALPPALLLGIRNAFYGVPITQIVRPRGWARLWTAHFVIDETTGMAVAQPNRRAGRYAFWATGLILFSLWNLGTLIGAVIGSRIDATRLGLDAAAPAIFLALLWPQMRRRGAPAVAASGALVAVALIPFAPAGVPVVAAAVVAVVAGFLPQRDALQSQNAAARNMQQQ